MLSCFVRSAIGVNVSGNAATRKSKSFKGSNVLGYFLSKFSLENCDRQITLGQMREHAFTFNTGINVYLLFLFFCILIIFIDSKLHTVFHKHP